MPCLGQCFCSLSSIFNRQDGKSKIQYRKLYGSPGNSGGCTASQPNSIISSNYPQPLPFGREILGVDITCGSDNLNDNEIIEIRRALIDHHLLLFRCQKPLSPKEQTQFCEKLFGETCRHPYPVNQYEKIWNDELDTYIPGHPDIWKVVSSSYTLANQRVLSKCALMSTCQISPQPQTLSPCQQQQPIVSPQQQFSPYSSTSSPYQQQLPQQNMYNSPQKFNSPPPSYNQSSYNSSLQSSYNSNYQGYPPSSQSVQPYGTPNQMQYQKTPYSPMKSDSAYGSPMPMSPSSVTNNSTQSTTYNIDKPTFSAGNYFYWNCDGSYRHEVHPTPITVWNAAFCNREEETLFTDLQLAYERMDEKVKEKTGKVFSII